MSKADVCFVMGTNREQVDLNEYLYGYLMEYSPIPVFNEKLGSWYDKPYLIKEALQLFEKAIWIDNDIEIISQDFFSIIESPTTSACLDYPMYYAYKNLVFNTGLVVIDEEHNDKWLKQLDRAKRSDQECFPVDGVLQLDFRFNYLRLMGPKKEDIFAYHWTGPVGKEIYRKKLSLGE